MMNKRTNDVASADDDGEMWYEYMTFFCHHHHHQKQKQLLLTYIYLSIHSSNPYFSLQHGLWLYFGPWWWLNIVANCIELSFAVVTLYWYDDVVGYISEVYLFQEVLDQKIQFSIFKCVFLWSLKSNFQQ